MGYMEQLQQVLDQMPNIPRETRDALRSMSDVFFLAVGGFVKLAVYSLAAMLGGAIGVALFEKRRPGADTPSPASPYQPPADLPPPDAPTLS